MENNPNLKRTNLCIFVNTSFSFNYLVGRGYILLTKIFYILLFWSMCGNQVLYSFLSSILINQCIYPVINYLLGKNLLNYFYIKKKKSKYKIKFESKNLFKLIVYINQNYFSSFISFFPPLILPVLLAAIKPTFLPALASLRTVDALPICWWLPPP